MLFKQEQHLKKQKSMDKDYNISEKGKKTLAALRDKADWTQGVRMPSIKAIHALLDEFEIPHTFDESSNTVERRGKGMRYVFSRHEGKQGYKLKFTKPDGSKVVMDTSDSYYTYKNAMYAEELMETINAKTL